MSSTVDLLSPSRLIKRDPQKATKAAERVKGATNEAEHRILTVLRAGTVVSTAARLADLTDLSLADTNRSLARLTHDLKLVRIGNDPIFGTPRYEPCGTY